jgi:hypothetical protein
VNGFALVALPPAFVTEVLPELAPPRTITRIKFAVSTLKLAAVPSTATAVGPTKYSQHHNERRKRAFHTEISCQNAKGIPEAT